MRELRECEDVRDCVDQTRSGILVSTQAVRSVGKTAELIWPMLDQLRPSLGGCQQLGWDVQERVGRKQGIYSIAFLETGGIKSMLCMNKVYAIDQVSGLSCSLNSKSMRCLQAV